RHPERSVGAGVQAFDPSEGRVNDARAFIVGDEPLLLELQQHFDGEAHGGNTHCCYLRNVHRLRLGHLFSHKGSKPAAISPSCREDCAMPMIPFGEWRPDMPELSQWAREALNVIPAEESYRP